MKHPSDYKEKLVIGVGNDDRGDDGIGLWVSERLRERNLPGLTARELRGDPIRLLDAWANAEWVFIVDALSSGNTPGSVHRFDVTRESLGAGASRFSSHGAGVSDAVELGRALNRLPSRVVIIGIEGKTFRCGAAISPAVRRGGDLAMESIVAEMATEKGMKIMHEWSLTRALVREVERTAAAHGERRIRAVMIKIGAQAVVSPEHLRRQFRLLARGTVAEGAAVEIETDGCLSREVTSGLYLESVEFGD